MIKFDDDDLITLPEAARTLPGKVHPATLWRWATKGRSGVRLPTLKAGRSRFTTKAHLQRFLVQSDPLQDAPPTVPLPSKSEADRYCEKEGL